MEATQLLRIAIGTTIREELEAGDKPYRTLSFQEILAHVHSHYGTMAPNDIDILVTQANLPFTSPKLFVSEAAAKKKLLKTLQETDAALNPHQKIQLLINCSAKCYPIQKQYNSFCEHYPLRADRTFDKLVNWITIRLQSTENIDTPQHMTANAATMDAQAAQIAKLTQQVEQLLKTKTTAPTNNTPKVKKYCFMHGKGNHSGDECNKMTPDTNYTDTMRQATKPCTLLNAIGEEVVGNKFK